LRRRMRSQLWLMGEVKVAGVGLGVMDERAAAWWSGGGDGRERKMVMEIS